MWLIPSILLVISCALFAFIQPIAQTIHIQRPQHDIRVIENLLKVLASAITVLALLLNIIIWKSESAFILTMTFMGPLMVLFIYQKSRIKS